MSSRRYTIRTLRNIYLTLFSSISRMNENMEFPGVSGEEIEWLQESFVQTISERLEVS